MPSCLTLRGFLETLASHKDGFLAFAAIVGPLATIIAIFVGVRMTNKQLYVNTASASHLKWVEELREDVARVLGILSSIHFSGTEGRQGTLAQLQYHRGKIRVLERHDSDIEPVLSTLIDQSIAVVQDLMTTPMEQRDYLALDVLTGDIITLAQIMIKEDKDRVAGLV
jgi:hypothetical protein